MTRRNSTDFLNKLQRDGPIPDKFEKRFEWWRDVIDGDKATVTGWHNAGSPDVKQIVFGDVAGDGVLRVEGAAWA